MKVPYGGAREHRVHHHQHQHAQPLVGGLFMLQRCAGSSSLALIDIKKPPTLRNKERSPLLRSVASFLIYTNAKELEPAKRSRIHFAQTNSMQTEST